MDYSPWLRENEDIVNQALASYDARQPAPQPSVTDEQLLNPAAQAPTPQVVPESAPVVAPQGRPAQALNQLTGERIESANQIADSLVREGVAQSEGAMQSAEQLGEQTEEAREMNADARQVRDENRVLQDRYRTELDQELEALKKPIPQLTRGQSVGTIIAGILGAIGGVAGSQGMAYGMQQIQEMIGSNIRRAEADRERSKEYAGELQKAIGSLGSDSSNEASLAGKLVANQLLVTETELRRIGEETKGTTMSENAFRLAEGVHDKARTILIEQKEREQAAAAAAAQKRAAQRAQQAATAEEAQLYAGLSRAKTDEERQDIAAMYGARGAKALKEFYDNRKAGVESSASEQADTAPLGREVEDSALWKSVSEAEKSDFRGSQAAYQSFEADAEKLKELLAKHGNESYSKHAAQMESIIGSMTGKYNKMMKFGALDAGTQELMKTILGNPTALWGAGSRSIERVDAAVESSRNGIEAQARNLGLRSNAPEAVLARSEGAPEDRMRPTPGQSPAPAASPARVSMRNPQTGHEVMVKPELVEAFQSKGYQHAQNAASENVRKMFGSPAWAQGR